MASTKKRKVMAPTKKCELLKPAHCIHTNDAPPYMIIIGDNHTIWTIHAEIKFGNGYLAFTVYETDFTSNDPKDAKKMIHSSTWYKTDVFKYDNDNINAIPISVDIITDTIKSTILAATGDSLRIGVNNDILKEFAGLVYNWINYMKEKYKKVKTKSLTWRDIATTIQISSNDCYLETLIPVGVIESNHPVLSLIGNKGTKLFAHILKSPKEKAICVNINDSVDLELDNDSVDPELDQDAKIYNSNSKYIAYSTMKDICDRDLNTLLHGTISSIIYDIVEDKHVAWAFNSPKEKELWSTFISAAVKYVRYQLREAGYYPKN